MFYRNIIEALTDWSVQPDRKPLLLRGARQVGKTTVVNFFGESFKQYISINLERPSDREAFASKDIHVLIQTLFLLKNKELQYINDTLLFIDEIQYVPEALNMLRYFYEEYPQLKVIAAGSLLETIFNDGFSVPVGRVDYMVMRPVSFPEFLGALGKTEALKQLHTLPIGDFAHASLIQLFHTYALIGGMPEIIKRYAETKDITAIASIYERLTTAYIDDVEKYGKRDTLIRVIRHTIRASFLEAGKRIKFQNFGRSDYASRESGEAFRILEKVFLLSLVYPTVQAKLPLLPDYKKSPRLQVLDTGMMNYFLGIQVDILGTEDLSKVHQGIIVEHMVGQELLARKFNVMNSLHFWVREKNTSQAEVDFVYPYQGKLIPIEVKSGKEGTLRSLHLFMDEAPHDMAIRFYAGKLSLSSCLTPSGKKYRLLNLPYYLVSMLDQYLAWFFYSQ